MAEALTVAPMAVDWRGVGQVRHGFTHFELIIDVLAAQVPDRGGGFRASAGRAGGRGAAVGDVEMRADGWCGEGLRADTLELATRLSRVAGVGRPTFANEPSSTNPSATLGRYCSWKQMA